MTSLFKKDWMHWNAKYTSHQIQNEILQGLAEMVQSEIIKEVKENEVLKKKENVFGCAVLLQWCHP